MKKIFCFLIVLLLASCGSDNTASLSTDAAKEVSASNSTISVQSVLSNIEKGRYREGELLIKFKSDVVAASSLKTHQSVGATSIKKFSVVPNLEHVKLPEGLSVKDAIIKYMSDPAVEYAEPNYIKRASATKPNDPHFGLQWSLLNTGQTLTDVITGQPVTGKPGADIKATDAWDITTGSSSVVVAIVDTGVDSMHPDLAANVIQGKNFVANPNTTDTTDDNGHGTHVSGIIGAVGNNGNGVAGVMWHVQLMPLKFLDADGFGDISGEISAIQFAIDHGAKIINASFGGPFSCGEYDFISLANNAGILITAAAGNGDCSVTYPTPSVDNDQVPCYPASYSNQNDPNLNNPANQCGHTLPALPNIISVAATDQNDNLSSYSNFGLNSVHVAAPGDNIFNTFPVNMSSYDVESGTSESVPHVAGLAGLLYSRFPDLNYLQVRDAILNNVDVIDALKGKVKTGGRINAYKALSSISQGGGSSDGGSKGGGCSIGGRQHGLASVADFAVILLPLVLIFISRYKRRFEK